IVLHQTEALVAIDVNSGRATRERHIEETALKTNLEAADEIARQLRLRDLAGLIVIDFIDMEEKRNNRSVERKLKDALKNDRARIQVGRISHFGLLEMSRQRLRQGMIENSSLPCPQCAGRGTVRSVSSCALSILREIEDHLINRKPNNLSVRCNREVAFYILNDKRDHLLSLESAWGVSIYIEPSGELMQADCEIDINTDRAPVARRARNQTVKIDSAFDDSEADDQTAASDETGADTPEAERDDQGRKRKRRRGRRGGRRSRERSNGEDQVMQVAEEPDADVSSEPVEAATDGAPGLEDTVAEPEAAKKKPRKRTRKPKAAAAVSVDANEAPEVVGDVPEKVEASEDAPAAAEAVVEDAADDKPVKPKRARKPRKSAKAKAAEAEAVAAEQAVPDQNGHSESPEPAAASNGNGGDAEPSEMTPEPRKWTPPAPTVDPDAPRKSGWWSKS
ncbi:MAG: ribonuclease E/G, partial [Aestuariivirgaceae bacterium]